MSEQFKPVKIGDVSSDGKFTPVSRDDFNALRPEVREAAEEIDEILGSFGNEEWKAIRAELLRLAEDAAMFAHAVSLGQRYKQRAEHAEAELADLKAKYAELDELAKNTVQCLREADKDADLNEAELAEMKQSFDLRWKADMRAIDHWRREHPGDDLTWPDHADLCVWLMGELAALRELHKVTCESAAANARELAALKARIADALIADVRRAPSGLGRVEVEGLPHDWIDKRA